MIPYINFVSFQIGPLTIYTWGLFASLGFAASLFIALRLAKRRGLEAYAVYDLFLLAIISAVIGGRIFHVFFYNWPYFSEHLGEVIDIRSGGLSLFGGLFGALTAMIVYFRAKKIRFWAYADSLAFSFPAGFALGRLGCALINDHPGKLTNLFLGVKYPDGVRHDLGLEEMLLTMLLAGVFLFFERAQLVEKQRTTGFYVIFLGLWYSATRFFLDFLRIGEPRLYGLTPGQYFSLVLAAVILFVIARPAGRSNPG